MLDLTILNDPVEMIVREMHDGDISVELDPAMDNIGGLEAYEHIIDTSIKDEIFARTQRAYACYAILEHKLYRHRTAPCCHLCWAEGIKTIVNPDKPVCPQHGPCQAEPVCIYENDKDYLQELKKKVGRSASTIKDNKQALRLAAENFGFDTMEKVLEYGGIDAMKTIKDASVIERSTARIIGLRNGHAPNGQHPAEFVKEQLNELGPITEAEDPSQWHYRLKDAIRPKQIRIWFQIDQRKRKLIWHKEVIEDGSPRHWSGDDILAPDVPFDVLEYYAKRLNCLDQIEAPEVVEIG